MIFLDKFTPWFSVVTDLNHFKLKTISILFGENAFKEWHLFSPLFIFL